MKSRADHVQNEYTLILVDAMNFCYSNFRGRSGLTDSNGRQTGMLYGASRFFITCKTKYRNAKVLYLWEGKDSWRCSTYPHYKKQRHEKNQVPDSDFMDSIEDVKYALTLMGIDQVSWWTMEADDLAANYVYDMAEGDRILLVTKDKDWYVLLEDCVDILSGHTFITRNDADAELGFPCENITLYKTLTGDASDEIKGVYRFPKELAVRLCRETDDYHYVPELLRLWGNGVWAEKVERDWNHVQENAILVETAELPHDVDVVSGKYDKDKLVEFLLSRSMKRTADTILRLE